MSLAPFLPPTRRPRQVLRRRASRYEAGELVPSGDTPGVVLASIQPPGPNDLAELAESDPGGDRVREWAIIYTAVADALTPSGRDDAPGDLVWHKGAWWLVVGRSDFDTLLGTPVAHARHRIVRQAPNEGAPADAPPPILPPSPDAAPDAVVPVAPAPEPSP